MSRSPPLPIATVPGGDNTQDEAGCITIRGRLPLERIFTNKEARLARQLRRFCRNARGRSSIELCATIESGIRGLGAMAMYFSAAPPLRGRSNLGSRERSVATLAQKLLEADEHTLEWSLPTKAVLSTSFGVAKVNFWASLRYTLEGDDSKRARCLRNRVGDAMEEAVYTRLAEELYRSFITMPTLPRRVRLAAIEQLVELWEGRLGFATNRFCPILRSAWAARCRTARIFGTMLGTSEVVALLLQECDPRFVDWLSDKGRDSAKIQAFEEFLFDLPFESIAKVRTGLRNDGCPAVGPREVARYLGSPPHELRPVVADARALFSSFRRRRAHAQHRALATAEGPKRTAESYILEAILLEQDARQSGNPQGTGE